VETIGNATLYHGDAFTILPTLEVSVLVTDPPYGTGWVKGGGAVGEFNAEHEKPDWDVFRTDWLLPFMDSAVVAVFCAPSRLDDLCATFGVACVARYRKTNVRPGGKDRELIVCNQPWKAARWEVMAYNGDNPFHPCQKPAAVMDWVIAHLPTDAQPIVDPFMGSGSTGVACLQQGRHFVGIEQDANYFRVACERIQAAQEQQRLFA
jgi:site-specific DNA-methyltransferase (adenine-specific)/modification methylase